MTTKRRGISPAITSIILIGVAVASGVGVYAVSSSQSNTSILKGAIILESASLIKQSNGEEWLSVTVKNNGNKAITATTAYLQVDTNSATAGIQPFGVNTSPLAMSPGQTSSTFVRVVDSSGAAITAQNIGDTLPLDIVSTTTDGSNVRYSTSVIVSMS